MLIGMVTPYARAQGTGDEVRGDKVGGDKVGRDKIVGETVRIESGSLVFNYYGELQTAIGRELADALTNQKNARRAAQLLRNRLGAILNAQQAAAAGVSQVNSALEKGFLEVVASLDRLRVQRAEDFEAALAEFTRGTFSIEAQLSVPAFLDCSTAAGACVRLSGIDAGALLELRPRVSSPFGAATGAAETVVFKCRDAGFRYPVATHRLSKDAGTQHYGWISVRNDALGDVRSSPVRIQVVPGAVCRDLLIAVYGASSQGDLTVTEILLRTEAPNLLYSAEETNVDTWTVRRESVINALKIYSSNFDRKVRALRGRTATSAIVAGRAAGEIARAIPPPMHVPRSLYLRLVDRLAWDVWAYRQLVRNDKLEIDSYCEALRHTLEIEIGGGPSSELFMVAWLKTCDEALKRHLGDVIDEDELPAELEVATVDSAARTIDSDELEELADERGLLLRYADSDPLGLHRVVAHSTVVEISLGGSYGTDRRLRGAFEVMLPIIRGTFGIGGGTHDAQLTGDVRLRAHRIADALGLTSPFRFEAGAFAGLRTWGTAGFVGWEVVPKAIRIERRAGPFTRSFEFVNRPALELGVMLRWNNDYSSSESTVSVAALVRVAVGDDRTPDEDEEDGAILDFDPTLIDLGSRPNRGTRTSTRATTP